VLHHQVGVVLGDAVVGHVGPGNPRLVERRHLPPGDASKQARGHLGTVAEEAHQGFVFGGRHGDVSVAAVIGPSGEKLRRRPGWPLLGPPPMSALPRFR
jgi:hypothetical protein